ncbi:MAG: MFS transporter [Actinobacteria bacterium]|nr:MFS transporter [Actinomycetota bacterium]
MSGIGGMGAQVRAGTLGVLHVVRHPVTSLQALAGDGPLYPLLILFGLNAVDELDRAAFAILAPEIRDEFELGFQGLLTLIAVVAAAALALQVPIAGMADRHPRVRLAMAGAVAWSFCSFSTGLATGIVFLGFARSGSAIGKAVNDPTHNSLLADWFPPADRPKAFSFHRAANPVGGTIGVLAAGLLGYYISWRAPFFVLAFPTLILVVLAVRLREPIRGSHERRAAGAAAEAVDIEEAPPSYAEAWRMAWKIAALRRIFAAMPFLTISFVGFESLNILFLEEVFGLDVRARAVFGASLAPLAVIGLVIGARVGTRLLARDPGLVLRFIALTSVVQGGLAVLYAVAPNLAVAFGAAATIIICGAILGPGILAVLSMVAPPRARAMVFSIGSLWILPGLLVLPFVGWIADNWGIRYGMVVMLPVGVIGGLIVASAGKLIAGDISDVWQTAAARSEVLLARQRGDRKLLLCRGLDVGYDGVQVLFGVDFEVQEGEIVALLGTNGAGKSTLLKAISGIAEADGGAVILDGRDITHAPPNEIAGHGVSQLPGGIGVFPSLTVRENLRAAAWLDRRRRSDDITDVLGRFPHLADRLDHRSGDLSGGQQQMLGLAMAFLSKPRLLMIDELTLGLAPVVVEQLLPMVEELAAEGVTVILVEQSVNIALTVAETAYFMEKGEIRFHGPTAELLERPDVLRSVFLEGVAAGVARAQGTGGELAAPATTSDLTDRGAAAEHDQSILELRGMVRSFGGILAVDGVDLDVRHREILGMIGPNGAGKTTLFDLVSGFTAADAGTVHLDGRPIHGLSASARARRGLGRSFQDARLFPALTVDEVLAVSLERRLRSRDPASAALRLPHALLSERRVASQVDELVDLMGLGAYRSKFVHELSTGTRRIVDLAAVVAHRPLVVLLDEPSSGIAQREAEALAPVLHSVRDELDCALVVIEHDMALLRSVVDRVVALDQGAVVAEGEPAYVLDHPDVVASYLGTDRATIARSGPTGD